MNVLDQDSVRLLAVENCASLGKLLTQQDCVASVLPVIIGFSQVLFICSPGSCFPADLLQPLDSIFVFNAPMLLCRISLGECDTWLPTSSSSCAKLLDQSNLGENILDFPYCCLSCTSFAKLLLLNLGV